LREIADRMEEALINRAKGAAPRPAPATATE
jgi:hypothetical protein